MLHTTKFFPKKLELMKTIPFFALFTLALFTFSACEKGGDVVDPPSNTELLADGPWKLIAQSVDPGVTINGTVVTNEFAQLADCFTDNIIDFTETGSFTIDEGDTKCDPADPALLTSGTWSLSESETKITLDEANSSNSNEFNLISVNRDELIITETFTDNNLEFTRTYTYEDIN